MAAKKKTKKTPAKKSTRTPLCWCGCGAEVNNYFRQGHDARFKGRAGSVARKEVTMTEATKGMPGAGVQAFRQKVQEARKAL
jgi:hypothetical protein